MTRKGIPSSVPTSTTFTTCGWWIRDGGLSLAQEAHLRLRYARDRGPQRLDREPLLQPEVQRFVHHAHPAFAQHAHDLVPAERLPDLQSFLVAHESLSVRPGRQRYISAYILGARSVNRAPVSLVSLFVTHQLHRRLVIAGFIADLGAVCVCAPPRDPCA